MSKKRRRKKSAKKSLVGKVFKFLIPLMTEVAKDSAKYYIRKELSSKSRKSRS